MLKFSLNMLSILVMSVPWNKSTSFSPSVRLSSRRIWEKYHEQVCQAQKRHRICVAALLLLLLHCRRWLEAGEKLKEEVVVIEAVDKEEEGVGDGESAAGVEGAVLPAASGHEEGGHVDLRPEGGKQEDLDGTNQQLWLVFSRVVELPPVLQVHNVLGGQVEGEEDGD